MPIVSFNLEKLQVEKLGVIKGKVEVKNNITIKNVDQKELTLGDSKKEGLRFDFEYVTSYDPSVGSITLHGHLFYLTTQKKAKEILKQWEKDRKLTKEIAPEIINTILMRCSVKTLALAQEVNLPPNISLPSLRPNNPKDVGSYIG